ncbi:MAG TPA: hypothetical protein VJU86_19985 [Pyrinomonadaceae bacterium]|nr:hypothetical protein [Pyrinomonadaceae bacterium]
MTQPYKSEAEIEAVVRGFEECTTNKEVFTHRQHLTVAVWYLWHSPEDALEKMRTGLLRFISHHQVDPGKYKEDLTVAWMDLTKKTLAELPEGIPLIEVTNAVLDRLSKASL